MHVFAFWVDGKLSNFRLTKVCRVASFADACGKYIFWVTALHVLNIVYLVYRQCYHRIDPCP